MARQIFAGGSDEYNASVGWTPPNRRGGGGMRGGGKRKPSGGGGQTMWGQKPWFGGEPPFDFDPSQGDDPYAPPGTPGSVQQPPTNPLSIDDWVKKFMLQPGRFENAFGDLLANSGVGVPNAPAVPTFEEMFDQYSKASKWTQDQNIAELGESFGSRGASYGSDILNAQTNARSRFIDEGRVKASEYLTLLEQQRQGREGQRQSLLQTQGGLAAGGAGLEEGRRALAYAQAFADFMRQASPPPGLGGAGSAAGSAGGTIAY